jgi:hypothetical protein
MATYYWVGGAGTWDATTTTNWATSSGGTGGAGFPTSADNVIIDSASGTGTITRTIASAVCADLTVTASQAIILAGTLSSLYGNLSYPAGGSFTVTGSTIFTATTTGKTITTNGKVISSFAFNGVGGGWTLQDDFTGNASTNTSSITLTNGSLNTNSKAINNLGTFTYSGTGVASLTLGSSVITYTSNTSAWNFGTITGLTFSGASSTINMGTGGATTSTFDGGGLTYGTLTTSFVSGATLSPDSFTLTGNNTFTNLSFGSRFSGNSPNILPAGGTQIVTGTFSTTGGSYTSRLTVKSSVTGTQTTINAAAVSLQYTDFTDVVGAGAATWTGTSLGNALGNSNITFSTPKTVYWNLGGSTSVYWISNAWATTPTGTPAAANFPLAQDTAVFTNAGSAGTLSVFVSGQFYNVGTINFSNRTSAMTFAIQQLNVLGDILLGTGVTSSGILQFSGRTTQTITSGGASTGCSIVINTLGGTVQLADDITLTVGAPSLTVTNGSFNSNGKNMQLVGFTYSGTGTSPSINISNSTITLTNSAGTYWNFATTTGLGSLITTGSTIVMTGNLVGTRVFAGGGLTYNNFTIGGTSPAGAVYSITGANTFTGTFSSTRPVAFTVQFAANQTISTWGVTGTAGNVVTVNSSVSGTQRTLTYTGSSRSSMNYMSIQDINFSYTLGAANPYLVYAGANSTNGGNNLGVAFINGTTQTAYLLTSGTTWTVPSDWNNTNNTIHMIGAGGGGATSAVSGNNRAAGGGGGGGGYTVVTNFSSTPSSSINYAIGSGGTATITAGSTTWNSSAYTAGGGGAGTATTTPTSAGGAGGTGTFAGGTGGAGGFGTAANTGYGGGAGGGAGGPNGVGGAGGTGFGSITGTAKAGGGGGGNGGGSAGGNASSGLQGNGGNNLGGTGGGVGNGVSGTFGGGGAGGVNATVGGSGGAGIDIANTIGGAGGAGGNTGTSNGVANTGLYGGGGMGSGVSITGTTFIGGAGSQGVIFIVYTPTGIASRLTKTGVLYANGYFDEVTQATISTSLTAVYSAQFDEVTLNGQASPQRRELRTGVVQVNGYFDETTGPLT